MSIVKKIKAIEKILDDEIRFFLHQDGGDVEIDDLKVVDGKTFVYIKYQGACVGCSGAATGTLYAIQNILTQEFGDSIEVRIVDDFEL